MVRWYVVDNCWVSLYFLCVFCVGMLTFIRVVKEVFCVLRRDGRLNFTLVLYRILWEEMLMGNRKV